MKPSKRKLNSKRNKREKSYQKFVKEEEKKKRNQFLKWSERRHNAKHEKELQLERLEDSSYTTYRQEIKELKNKERESAKSTLFL